MKLPLFCLFVVMFHFLLRSFLPFTRIRLHSHQGHSFGTVPMFDCGTCMVRLKMIERKINVVFASIDRIRRRSKAFTRFKRNVRIAATVHSKTGCVALLFKIVVLNLLCIHEGASAHVLYEP